MPCAGCVHVCCGQRQGIGSTGVHPARSLPAGKAAWALQEQSFFGHLLVLRIQPSALAAGLRGRRKFWGGSECGGFVGVFLGAGWLGFDGFLFWLVSEDNGEDTACKGSVRSACSGCSHCGSDQDTTPRLTEGVFE